MGSIYHAEIPAGGLAELLGAFKQVITQNQALWQEMKSLKEQVREGGGSKAMKELVDAPRPVLGGGDLLGLSSWRGGVGGPLVLRARQASSR